MKLLLCLAVSASLFAADTDLQPLLLTARTSKRLKLDRERQTDRWAAFDQRVKAAVESPERGVELAVYFASTGDVGQGHAAIAWTLSHPCNALNEALVASATESLQSADESEKLHSLTCPDAQRPLARFGIDTDPATRDQFLLLLRPEELAHPTWQQHVAALILVTLAPNSQSAQFLQGWASIDRYVLRDGPGVVYEFLYADPYLPGVSYENMEPWSYRLGALLARSDWTSDACWIHVTAAAREQEHCPPDIWTHSASWGNLLVVPVGDRCFDLPKQQGPILLSNLPKERRLAITAGEMKEAVQSDSAGLAQVPPGISGKVCLAK